MILAFYLIFFFLTAIAADWLAVRWHQKREALEVAATMKLSAIIETINWAPIVFAIDSDIVSAKVIALLNIAGTTIGVGGAMLRIKRERMKEKGHDEHVLGRVHDTHGQDD